MMRIFWAPHQNIKRHKPTHLGQDGQIIALRDLREAEDDLVIRIGQTGRGRQGEVEHHRARTLTTLAVADARATTETLETREAENDCATI